MPTTKRHHPNEIRRCRRHVKHQTHDQAELEIVRMAHYKQIDPSLGVWECPVCGGFHVGRGTARDRRNRLRRWLLAED